MAFFEKRLKINTGAGKHARKVQGNSEDTLEGTQSPGDLQRGGYL